MTTQNSETINKLDKILKIFTASEGFIKPHFILTGPSGAGKSYNVRLMAENYDLHFMET